MVIVVCVNFLLRKNTFISRPNRVLKWSLSRPSTVMFRSQFLPDTTPFTSRSPFHCGQCDGLQWLLLRSQFLPGTTLSLPVHTAVVDEVTCDGIDTW